MFQLPIEIEIRSRSKKKDAINKHVSHAETHRLILTHGAGVQPAPSEGTYNAVS